MGKVRVACRQINGVTIALFKPGYDDGTGSGYKPIVRDGDPIVLKGPSALHTGAGNTEGAGLEAGITHVDADFMERWLAQNKDKNPLLNMGMIQVLGPVEEEKCDGAVTQEPAPPAGKPEERLHNNPPPSEVLPPSDPSSPAASPPASISEPTGDRLPKNSLPGSAEDPESPL